MAEQAGQADQVERQHVLQEHRSDPELAFGLELLQAASMVDPAQDMLHALSGVDNLAVTGTMKSTAVACAATEVLQEAVAHEA